MRDAMLAKADLLRMYAKRPLVVTSATRCKAHNAAVGGAADSQHLLGNAIDIACASRAEAEALAVLAIKAGMGGIGVGDDLLHVDDGPQGRRWTYPRPTA